MLPFEGNHEGLLIIGSLIATVVVGCAMSLMPSDLATVLAVWTALSIPFGIAIGHCILPDE